MTRKYDPISKAWYPADGAPTWDPNIGAWFDGDGNMLPAPEPPAIEGKYLSYENRVMQRQEQAAKKIKKAIAAVDAEAAAEGVPSAFDGMRPNWMTITPKPEMTELEITKQKLDAAAVQAARERDAQWGDTIDYADIRREEAERLRLAERQAELREAMGLTPPRKAVPTDPYR